MKKTTSKKPTLKQREKACAVFAEFAIGGGYAYLRGCHGRALARRMLERFADQTDQAINDALEQQAALKRVRVWRRGDKRGRRVAGRKP